MDKKLEKTSKMIQEITEVRKLPEELKSNLKREIFINILVAIALMLYVSAINLIYIYVSPNSSEILLKAFTIVAIIITVFTFEASYRKDSIKLALFGIEFFISSIVILWTPKIYANINDTICSVLVLFPIISSFYYVIKSICICGLAKREYQCDLSDVKEIVKEEVEML